MKARSNGLRSALGGSGLIGVLCAVSMTFSCKGSYSVGALGGKGGSGVGDCVYE